MFLMARRASFVAGSRDQLRDRRYPRSQSFVMPVAAEAVVQFVPGDRE
jgi:hypothetical protein